MLKVVFQNIKATAIDRLERKPITIFRKRDLTPDVDVEAVLH